LELFHWWHDGVPTSLSSQHFDNWNGWLVQNGIPHDNGSIPQVFYEWFGQQKQWSEQQAALNYGKDANWTLAHLVNQQFEGLMVGYNANAEADKRISALDHWMIVQSLGDILNLNTILMQDPKPVWERFENTGDLLSWMRANSHCSGLVKTNGDLSFLSSAHVAWFSYSSMLRIFKHYENDFSTTAVKANDVSFSSYPGLLSSLDDFYMTGSTKLSMVQTTNNFMNTFTPNSASVLAWQRVRMAMMGATGGQSWCQILGFHHSGTCKDLAFVLCNACTKSMCQCYFGVKLHTLVALLHVNRLIALFAWLTSRRHQRLSNY